MHRDVEHVDGVVERKLPRAEEAEEPLAAGHAEERCVAYAGGGERGVRMAVSGG